MKLKTITTVISALILAATLMSTSANAGLWDMVKNAGGESIETNQYTIEVSGTNIRGYVFDVPAMKSICISVWGQEGSSHQLDCKTYAEIEAYQESK